MRRAVFDIWPAASFRAGVDAAAAADIFAALCNGEVYRILVEERGLIPDQVEDWWSVNLPLLILDGDMPPG